MPSRHAIALWLTPIVGAVIWIGTYAVARIVPGASRVSWALNGDALNNLVEARLILTGHGLAIGSSGNPVPLPASLLAFALAPGRSAIPTADLALREFATFALVWMLLIAATCLLTGAVVGSMMPSGRPGLVALASGSGSLLPLTWYVTGLPVQWSYLNANVAIPLALGAWLVFLGARRRPLVAFFVLTGFITLTLATWSPLVVIPVSLAIVILVRERARFRMLSGVSAVAFALSFAQCIAWLGLITAPTFGSQNDQLGNPSNGFPSVWPAAVATLVVLLACAALLRRRQHGPEFAGVIALAAAALAATGTLVYFAARQTDPWGAYYPKKLAWMLSVIVGVIALSFLLRLLVERVRPGRAVVVLVSTVGVTLAIAAGLPAGSWPETLVRQPTVRILAGAVWHTGDAAVAEIARLSKPGHPGLLWQSDDPDEAFINSHAPVVDTGYIAGEPQLNRLTFGINATYRTTGTYDNSNIGTLCKFVRLMHPTPTVYTANPKLESQLRSACPSSRPRFVVKPNAKPYVAKPTGPHWATDGLN